MKNKKYISYIIAYALFMFAFPRVLVWGNFLDSTSKAAIDFLLLYQAIVYIALGLVGLLLFKDEFSKSLSELKGKVPKLILYTVLTYFAMVLTNVIVNIILQSIITVSQNQLNVMEMITSSSGLLAFIIVIFGPLTEEITYRHCIISLLDKKLPVLPVSIISIILFAAAHLSPGEFTAIIPYIVIGSFVTYFYRKWNNNMWASFAVHALNNFIAFMLISLLAEYLVQ